MTFAWSGAPTARYDIELEMIGDGLRPANAEISFVLTEGCRDSTEYVRRHGDGGTEARNLEAAGIEIPQD